MGSRATYPEDDGVTPRNSLSVFPQYLLDRYATVAEAVADLKANRLSSRNGTYPSPTNWTSDITWSQ